MHRQESVQEYKTYKIILEFKIQMDHLIPTGRPDYSN